MYVLGVLAVFSQLPPPSCLGFEWLFKRASPFLSRTAQWAGSLCGQLVGSPVLLTLGRFGGWACPVTEGLGQVEDVKALPQLRGPWGMERRSESPGPPILSPTPGQIRYSGF